MVAGVYCFKIGLIHQAFINEFFIVKGYFFIEEKISVFV
jgi:hypothetical protein